MKGRLVLGAAVVVLCGLSFLGGILVQHYWPIALPTGEVPTPEPISPGEGATVPNGDINKGIPVRWTFTWTKVPRAERYQLVVEHAGSTSPYIDVTVDAASYEYYASGFHFSSVSVKGWRWRVRAQRGERWSGWSEYRRFDLTEASK